MRWQTTRRQFQLLWLTVWALCDTGLAGSAIMEVVPGQSINAAIQKAAPGTTIRIAAGIFVENLNVSKPMTLEGAGWDRTVIKAQRSITTAKEEDLVAAMKAGQSVRSADEATKARLAWAEKLGGPTLAVRDCADVVIRGIQFMAAAPPAAVEGLLSEPVVRVSSCTNLTMTGCAITGPFWDGIHVVEGSRVVIAKSLVAGLWGTGIVIEGARGSMPASTADIKKSDIRNCYHRGITIGAGSDKTVIARCRISGSAWHGIRYDDASPAIDGCAIFSNARSGIYASGKTEARIEGNVFFANEMDGLSCWFANRDLVARNTFVDNRREAIAVMGDSQPRFVDNVFYGHPVAVQCSRVAGKGESAVGSPVLQGNFFWNNAQDYDAGSGPAPLPGTNNRKSDPLLRSPATKNFALAENSPARAAGAGAVDVVSLESPFPLTPGERGIIPDGDTRDSRAWHQPGKPAEVRAPTPTRPAEDTTRLIDQAFRIDSTEARDAALAEISRRMESDEPRVILSGLHALGMTLPVEFDRTPMRETVRALLQSPDDEIRAAATGTLAWLHPEPGDEERLLAMAADPSPPVRQAAAGAIVALSDKQLVGRWGTAMLPLLKDADPSVRRNALVVLWGAHVSRELENQLLLMSRENETQYDTVYFGLSTFPEKSEAVVERLLEFLPHRDQNVGGRALWGLGFGVPESLQPKVAEKVLLLLQARANPRARQECLSVLATYGTVGELPALRNMAAQPAIYTQLKTNLEATVEAIERRSAGH